MPRIDNPRIRDQSHGRVDERNVQVHGRWLRVCRKLRHANCEGKSQSQCSRLLARWSNAQTFQDILTLQTQFAQDRMQAFTTHTQELLGAIEEMILKLERGALGADKSAMSSNLLAAGFTDARDRAMQIAMEFSESAFTFAGKMGNAQNLPRYCDASDGICSRPSAGFHHADAGALQADRRNCPEPATRLMSKAIQSAGDVPIAGGRYFLTV